MEDVESLLSQTLSQDKATSSAVGQLRTQRSRQDLRVRGFVALRIRAGSTRAFGWTCAGRKAEPTLQTGAGSAMPTTFGRQPSH